MPSILGFSLDAEDIIEFVYFRGNELNYDIIFRLAADIFGHTIWYGSSQLASN